MKSLLSSMTESNVAWSKYVVVSLFLRVFAKYKQESSASDLNTCTNIFNLQQKFEGSSLVIGMHKS